MSPNVFQRPLIAAILVASAIPFVGLSLRVNVSDPMWMLGGVLGFTLVMSWGLSHVLAKRFAEWVQDEMSRHLLAVRKDTESHQKSDSSGKLESIISVCKRLILLTEEHQQRASATTSTAAKATESATAIAGAIEEMKAAIQEIGRQAEQASCVASEAVEKTQGADNAVTTLTEHMKSIVGIVDMIRSVAERTNLLALNATIEAARAGEHGRGFAVVAQEVKALATQTAEATGQIEGKIAEVQVSSQDARQHMQNVQQVIQQINSITLEVKGALQQQTAATSEIVKCAETTTIAVDGVTAGISHLLVTTEEIRRTCVALDEKAEVLKG